VKSPVDVTPRYLRVPQAAAYLGFAPKTLYRLVEEKRIPYIRKRRTVFQKVKGSNEWWIRYADQYGRIHREKVGPPRPERGNDENWAQGRHLFIKIT